MTSHNLRVSSGSNFQIADLFLDGRGRGDNKVASASASLASARRLELFELWPGKGDRKAASNLGINFPG